MCVLYKKECFSCSFSLNGSRIRDSSVSTVVRLRTGWWGSRIPVEVTYFSPLQSTRTGAGARSVSFSVGSEVLSREVYHSPTPCADVKNECHYSSSPTIRLHGVDRDNLPFSLTFKWFHNNNSPLPYFRFGKTNKAELLCFNTEVLLGKVS
jgi:hypothetical protein